MEGGYHRHWGLQGDWGLLLGGANERKDGAVDQNRKEFCIHPLFMGKGGCLLNSPNSVLNCCAGHFSGVVWFHTRSACTATVVCVICLHFLD